MKSFDRKDVYSWASCNELRLATTGYVGNSLSDLTNNIASNRIVQLLSIDENSAECFAVENKQNNLIKTYHFAFFLPADKVKDVEKPKTYRPFRKILEFISTLNSQVGESIRLRAKCSDPFENVFLIDGYTETSKRELKYIFLSGIRYTPEELFRNYEFNKDGHWQPFGVEE